MLGIIIIILAICIFALGLRMGSRLGLLRSYVPVDGIRNIPDGLPVVINGTITALKPLSAPLTHKPCVYFHYVIEQQVEETDKAGKVSVVWRQVDNPEEQRIPFSIQDETGSILIKPDHAAIEAYTLTDRFLSENAISAVKNHTLVNILSELLNPDQSQPTHQRMRERSLEVGTMVNIFGILSMEGNEKFFQHTSRFPLIITTKSKDQLIHAARWQGFIMYPFALAVLAYGVYLVTQYR